MNFLKNNPLPETDKNSTAEIDPKTAYIKDLKTRQEPDKYFKEALSDFMYDAAAGRAVRRLADDGYTCAQIAQRLDYPVPAAKIKTTLTKHFYETGLLTAELPVSVSCLKSIPCGTLSEQGLFSMLAERIRLNGEEHSYIGCPFGSAAAKDVSLKKALSVLTKREQDYIESIVWESPVIYHRLNRRMLEIGTQLAMHSDAFSFYFLKSLEVLYPRHRH